MSLTSAEARILGPFANDYMQGSYVLGRMFMPVKNPNLLVDAFFEFSEQEVQAIIDSPLLSDSVDNVKEAADEVVLLYRSLIDCSIFTCVSQISVSVDAIELLSLVRSDDELKSGVIVSISWNVPFLIEGTLPAIGGILRMGMDDMAFNTVASVDMDRVTILSAEQGLTFTVNVDVVNQEALKDLALTKGVYNISVAGNPNRFDDPVTIALSYLAFNSSISNQDNEVSLEFKR